MCTVTIPSLDCIFPLPLFFKGFALSRTVSVLEGPGYAYLHFLLLRSQVSLMTQVTH
jgi:hypothetical protein